MRRGQFPGQSAGISIFNRHRRLTIIRNSLRSSLERCLMLKTARDLDLQINIHFIMNLREGE